MRAKVLLTANKLGLFSELAKGPLDAEELRERLKLHARGATDFFDAPVSLGMLSRRGGVYYNSNDSDFFLDEGKPSYIGGLLEYDDEHLYPAWGKLGESLKTGNPQSGVKEHRELFDSIYSDHARLKTFLRAMTGVSAGPAKAIAEDSHGLIMKPSSMSAWRRGAWQSKSPRPIGI